MNDLVTAVLTTYKREPKIVERALKSILAQTYDNLEIIVVDDSPSDYPLREEVAATVMLYQHAGVRYIQHSQNSGACVARNTGLEAANGKFIAYLDDDDEWLPEKIEKQVSVFSNSDESVGLVYNDFIFHNEKTGEIILKKSKKIHGHILHELLEHGNVIGGTSIPLIRTSVLREIGGFDVLLEAAQDYDVWVRIAERYTIKHIDEYLNRYYFHNGEQITFNLQKRLSGRLRIIQKYEHYFTTEKGMCWRLNMDVAWIYADMGQKKKAICIYLRNWWKKPFQIIGNMRYLYYILR